MTPQPKSHEITAHDIAALQPKLRGRLLRAGDLDYDTARKVHNGMIDRHPGLIIRCKGTADVARALEFGI